MTKKISSLQLAAVMLCMSFSGIAAYRPEGTSLTAAAVSEILCSALLFLAAVPLFRRGKQALRGKAASAVFLVFGAFYLCIMLQDLAYTLQYAFPRLYSSAAVIALTAAAALYCASMGTRACAKAACPILALAVLFTLLTCIGASEHFALYRIALPGSPVPELERALTAAASRSGEIAVFAALLPKSDAKPLRTAAVYSLFRAAAGAALLLFTKGVLGSLADQGQPVFMLSSCSKTAVIERFDAAVLLVWVLAVCISCAVIAGLASDSLAVLFPMKNKLHLGAVFCAGCAAAALAAFSEGFAADIDTGAVPVMSVGLMVLCLAAAYLSAANSALKRKG